MESASSYLTPDHLTQIRQNTDWRRLFLTLCSKRDSKKSREHDWWGKSPFRPDERTASFHMNASGWYCHATGQGGGAIDLVQLLYPEMDCYAAGRWLLENGISTVVANLRHDLEALAQGRRDEDQREASCENLPIRQDLRAQLDPNHPLCAERGIPPEVLRELGAGYLERPPRKGGRPDPLNRRIVFQIRGLRENDSGYLEPVILGHIGRATTSEQLEQHGKWWTHPGFKKSFELFNLDKAILDQKATEQAHASEHVLVVEGPFDVAKLYAAGIRNVVATFGAHLSPAQIRRLDLIDEVIGVNRFLFFYDRDKAGRAGAEKALEAITASGLDLRAEAFDWNLSWESPTRGRVGIPSTITDPAEFSVEQLRWLRREGWL